MRMEKKKSRVDFLHCSHRQHALCFLTFCQKHLGRSIPASTRRSDLPTVDLLFPTQQSRVSNLCYCRCDRCLPSPLTHPSCDLGVLQRHSLLILVSFRALGSLSGFGWSLVYSESWSVRKQGAFRSTGVGGWNQDTARKLVPKKMHPNVIDTTSPQ